MNNIKKTALGALVAVLTIGFSAFTTIKKRATILYYKVDMTYPAANDPRGYEYHSGDRCESNGSVCSAVWNIGTYPTPTLDGTPLPTGVGVSYVSNSAEAGHFE